MHTVVNLARLLPAAILVLAGSAVVPASAQTDPAATIDSRGALVPVERSRGIVSPSFEGRGRTLRPGEKDDTQATPRTREQEADDERRLRRARPVRGPAIESVIGNDTRVRVTETTKPPARYTVHILFSETPGGGDFICSGWLINANTVVTAGHCVGAGNGTGYFPASTYRIFPGRNGTSKPYGSCGATRLFSVGRWLNQGRDDYDYAAIKLDCNIGTTTGWFGYAANAGPAGTAITIQGYPGDKSLGQQWKAKGTVTAQQTRRTFYPNDTFGGMSGSPIWHNGGAGCKYCGIAIHAYGTGGKGLYANNNHGTRINQDVFDNLTTWKNATP